jgi:hypothetical protein
MLGVMPRQRPRSPAAELDLGVDLYDYEKILQPRLPKTPVPRVSMTVTDNWPRVVPIGMREIEVTETYLGKVLAELLGPLP